MTQDKEDFLNELLVKVHDDVVKAYTNGDKCHENDFFKVDFMSELFKELIDGLTYAYGKMKTDEDRYEKGFADGFRKAITLQEKPEEAD